MRTFAQAREKLIEDLRQCGVVDIDAQLAQAEATLCEDNATVMLYVPNGVDWWTASSFDLPAPIDPKSFIAADVEQMFTLPPAAVH